VIPTPEGDIQHRRSAPEIRSRVLQPSQVQVALRPVAASAKLERDKRALNALATQEVLASPAATGEKVKIKIGPLSAPAIETGGRPPEDFTRQEIIKRPLALKPEMLPLSWIEKTLLRREGAQWGEIRQALDAKAIEISWQRFQAGNDINTVEEMLEDLNAEANALTKKRPELLEKSRQHIIFIVSTRPQYVIAPRGQGIGGKFLAKGTTLPDDIYRSTTEKYFRIPSKLDQALQHRLRLAGAQSSTSTTIGTTSYSEIRLAEHLMPAGTENRLAAAKQYLLPSEAYTEFHMMRRLPHSPHFSSIRELIQVADGNAILFLEFAGLGDADRLHKKILTSTKLNGVEKYHIQLALAQQYMEAVDEMHNHETPVFHQDIHPKNFVISGDGRALLIDFGSASPDENGGITGGRARREVPGAELDGGVNTVVSKRYGDRYMLAKTLLSISDNPVLRQISDDIALTDRPMSEILRNRGIAEPIKSDALAEFLKRL
jgi:hypothetical protein